MEWIQSNKKSLNRYRREYKCEDNRRNYKNTPKSYNKTKPHKSTSFKLRYVSKNLKKIYGSTPQVRLLCFRFQNPSNRMDQSPFSLLYLFTDFLPFLPVSCFLLPSVSPLPLLLIISIWVLYVFFSLPVAIKVVTFLTLVSVYHTNLLIPINRFFY